MTDKNNFPVLLAVTLSAFLTPFMGSALNVALPLIGKEFSMTALALSWVASSFLLAAAITLVPVGRLSDIYGRRRIFLYGALVFTVSSSLCIWSPNADMLIFLRVFQGIGGAMIFSTGTALLISDYPVNKRGRILGINLAAVYTGLTFGPFAGGLLTEHFGWRYVFLFSALLGVIITLIMARIAGQERPTAKGESFDFTGSVLYGMSLFAVMYGFSLLPASTAAVFIILGIICLIGFITRQLNIPYPLLDIHLFLDNRVFAFSNLAALINYCATFAVTFLLSIYLQQVKMLSPAQAGFVLVAEPIVLAVCSPFAGRLSDRFEPQLIASIGMALTVIGLCLLLFIAPETSLSYIIACLILLGVGFALFSSPNVNATMSAVGNKFYGVASATLATMRITGQMFSMGITMLVFAFILGQHAIADAEDLLLIKSARIIYLILAFICVCGVFFSATRGKVHK
ncbi:MAG TPA: MFS transporter [Smithellaceae bacterium]|nr:MFS transporter [Smithellaceae bacterium]HRS89457.1 MFS transporter [Smithellaceae bacterium]HRV26406.1 MFS transporter [Smithellaceae bacterium]